MEKRIQLPLSLYELMVAYIQDHYDAADHQRFYKILSGIQAKQDAEIRRNLYSSYKRETDPETREMLRISYLDKSGIHSHGRWDEITERKYMKGEFYD